MIFNISRTCERCGKCCLKGGPVLHSADKTILLSGLAGHADLVTIRKGETVMNPASGRLEACGTELVKVRGVGSGWACIFHRNEDHSCEIYEHRFLECRALRCWDASEIIQIIGKDTIVRSDLINPNDPVLELVSIHETECPSVETGELIRAASEGQRREPAMERLAEILREDRTIRSHALSECGMKPEHENFIFGRRITELLSAAGIVLPWR